MTWRVIQWATGNVGRSSLRSLLQHPEIELAGVLVHDPAKAGRDAGELCGQPPAGIAATDDVEAIFALDADCVLHTPLPAARIGPDPEADLRDICRLLASGKNVVTTVGYVYPAAYGPEVVARIEAACAQGQSSLHGTGVNPGWLGELLPLTLSAMSARIDRVVVYESSEFSRYPSPEVVCEMMGLGRTPEAWEADAAVYRGWLGGLFRESVHLLADGLALALEEVREESEIALAEADFEIAAGPIARGTVAAQRFVWSGIAGGAPRIVLEAVYRARADVQPDWRPLGCGVSIEGRPAMALTLDESWLSNGLLATAMHAVHAVPHLCRAQPGIRTFLDLPLITGRYTAGH